MGLNDRSCKSEWRPEGRFGEPSGGSIFTALTRRQLAQPGEVSHLTLDRKIEFSILLRTKPPSKSSNGRSIAIFAIPAVR